MAKKSVQLNKKQVDVLEWIRNGRPEGIYTSGYQHRIIARALERRSLIDISGSGPTWSAAFTEAGQAWQDGPPQNALPVEEADRVITEVPEDALPAETEADKMMAQVLETDGRLLLPEDRAVENAEIEHATKDRETQIAMLASILGDREDIVDKYGCLPRDRRKANLLQYRLNREHKVRELGARIPELNTAATESKDRTERSKLRSELQTGDASLKTLLAVPPLTEDDVCSECARPASRHGWVSPPYDGPCPAWPV